MRMTFSIAAACGTATFTGAMLVIGLVLGNYWKSLPPAEFLDWFATNSNLVARVIPLFVVPALVGLMGGVICDWHAPPRTLWLAALVCMAGILAITFFFHLPMNSVFNAKAVPLADVSGMLDRWLWLHAIRIVLGLSASIFCILAISSGSERGVSLPEPLRFA